MLNETIAMHELKSVYKILFMMGFSSSSGLSNRQSFVYLYEAIRHSRRCYAVFVKMEDF